MTARLVDELLRTFGQAQEILEKHVAYLKPLPQDAIVKEGESLLFSAVGRGSDPLFKRLGYMGRKPTQFSAGLTYPEEVDIVPDEKVSVFNLPASWTAVFKHAVFGADVARDALARRTAAVVSIARASGETEDIASRLRGIPFDGSSLFWREFAKAYDVEVLTTSYDPLEKITKLEGWYAGVSRKGREAQKFVKQYVVLDVEGIPLQRIDNGTFLSQEAGLPATIRLWLESHVPMEKPIAAATIHGGVPETKENDEDVAAAVPAIAPVIAPVIPAAPPVAKKDEKACPPEQILNPATGKCVKRDGVIGKKLVKALADVQPAIGEEVEVAVAAPPQVQRDRAGNPCPPGTIFNPDSQRISTDCVKRDGKKGKEILAAAAAAAPALPALPALPAAAPAPIPAVEELVAAEPALVAEAAPPMKLARCPPGTRRSKKTGNCEPTKA
jgi:hypothetical protein